VKYHSFTHHAYQLQQTRLVNNPGFPELFIKNVDMDVTQKMVNSKWKKEEKCGLRNVKCG